MPDPQRKPADILVVDDDARIRDMLKRILSNEGFTVRTADGPDQAIVALKEAKFDAVVLDVRMPEPSGRERSGIEVLSFMRENEQLRAVPVLVVTGSELSQTEEKAIWGLQAYVLNKSEGHQPVLEYLKHLTTAPKPGRPA
jgi:CheY-like chemotaxis protein